MVQVEVMRREDSRATAIRKRGNAKLIVDKIFVAEHISYYRNRFNFEDSFSYCRQYLPISRA